MTSKKLKHRQIRAKKTRKKIGRGTKDRPRLSVFRSNRKIFAQLIDDSIGKTLVSVISEGKIINIDLAQKTGEKLAKDAIKKGIEKCIFDRGGYLFHGRIQSFAEAARKNGLQF